MNNHCPKPNNLYTYFYMDIKNNKFKNFLLRINYK